jgi:hypothetical protein
MHLLPRSLLLSLTTTDPALRSPRTSPPVDEDYWLRHCEGFRVDGPEGRLGIVEHVVYGSRRDRPEVVAITSGMWRTRTDDVLIADVVEVWPARGRLVVRGGLGRTRHTSLSSRAQKRLRTLAGRYER